MANTKWLCDEYNLIEITCFRVAMNLSIIMMDCSRNGWFFFFFFCAHWIDEPNINATLKTVSIDVYCFFFCWQISRRFVHFAHIFVFFALLLIAKGKWIKYIIHMNEKLSMMRDRSFNHRECAQWNWFCWVREWNLGHSITPLTQIVCNGYTRCEKKRKWLNIIRSNLFNLMRMWNLDNVFWSW